MLVQLPRWLIARLRQGQLSRIRLWLFSIVELPCSSLKLVIILSLFYFNLMKNANWRNIHNLSIRQGPNPEDVLLLLRLAVKAFLVINSIFCGKGCKSLYD